MASSVWALLNTSAARSDMRMTRKERKLLTRNNRNNRIIRTKRHPVGNLFGNKASVQSAPTMAASGSSQEDA